MIITFIFTQPGMVCVCWLCNINEIITSINAVKPTKTLTVAYTGFKIVCSYHDCNQLFHFTDILNSNISLFDLEMASLL